MDEIDGNQPVNFSLTGVFPMGSQINVVIILPSPQDFYIGDEDDPPAEEMPEEIKRENVRAIGGKK